MNPVAFLIAYAKWHYGHAIPDIIRVWGNFLWLSLHFFSTGTLVRTLFSPFMRMHEDYPEKGHFDPGYYAGTVLVNTLMRIVGFFVRIIFILLSLSVFSILFAIGVLFIGLWITAPAALILFISTGIGLVLVGLG